MTEKVSLLNALPEHLRSRVRITNGCWVWTGSKSHATNGFYGLARHEGKRHSAHRLIWQMFNGPVPEGLELDHLCRVTLCVNPEHLEAVTHRTNQIRGTSFVAERVRQTHCIHGHELVGANLRVRPDGRRQCRECDRQHVKALEYRHGGGAMYRRLYRARRKAEGRPIVRRRKTA